MIKLKNLLELNKMTYNSGPEGEQKKRMMMELKLFDDEYTLPNQLPPENSSQTTLDEVKYLQCLEVDKSYVEKYDKVKQSFKEVFEELGLPYMKEELKSLLKESGKFITELKYKYNRPRPKQIAEFYGFDFDDVDLGSMKTPSYPSGHAVQGYLIGEILSNMDKTNAVLYKGMGEEIAHSRILAKAHYPSDKTYGHKIAMELFKAYK